MPEFIDKQERRLHRLINFLKPYRKIVVSLVHDLGSAFAFEMKKDSKLILKVSPLILQKNSPDWIEATLVRLSVEKSKTRQIDFESEQFKEKLENAFIEAKEKQKELIKLIPTEEGSGIPDIKLIWKKLRLKYFPDREDIDDYKVKWSKRKQTSCLASCSIHNKRVVVAEAMADPESTAYLEPLIYHEMCHAILGEPKVVKGRRIMHGKDFKALERKHPEIPALNKWIKDGGWSAAVKRTHNPDKKELQQAA